MELIEEFYCRGDLSQEARQSIHEAFVRGDTGLATHIDRINRGQSRYQEPGTHEQERLDRTTGKVVKTLAEASLGPGCGYRLTDEVAQVPRDGKRYIVPCPQCGRLGEVMRT